MSRLLSRMVRATSGLEYNGVTDSYMIARKVWSFDIARTPWIVKDNLECIDVNDEIVKVNGHRFLVDKCANRIMRGRL